MSIFISSKNVVLIENEKYTVSAALIEIDGSNIKSVKKIEQQKYDAAIKELSSRGLTAGSSDFSFHNYHDRLISPAFINCHTHIAMSFFKSILKDRTKSKNLMEDSFFKIESKLTKEDVYAFAKIGAYENILSGNGLIWDHYYHGHAVAKACQDTGLSAVVAPTLQDISGPGVSLWRQGIQETAEINEDSKFSEHGIFSALGPHATDTVSHDLFKHCVTLSKKWNVPIHCHAAQSFEEVARIQKKHKKTPLAFLDSLEVLKNPTGTLLAHGIHVNKKDLSLLHQGKNSLVFCPFSQMIFQFPADVMQWEKNKCQWFVATDCVASNDSMNVQKELRFVAGFPSLKNTFGLKKNQYKETKKIQDHFSDSSFLLNKVFAGPGSFHPKFKAGEIAQGALANIIIWDTQHPAFWPPVDLLRNLAMGDTTGAIYNMYIAGKKLGTDGDFTRSLLDSDDYKEAHEEANTRLKAMNFGA